MFARPILSLAVLAIIAPSPASAQGTALPPFLELAIPKSPTVAAGDGAAFLAYELHLTNFAQQTMTLKRVEVAAAGGSVTMGSDPADPGFAWDNEQPAHGAPVDAFVIDVHDTTNAEFMAFVDAGGYRYRRWWRSEA